MRHFLVRLLHPFLRRWYGWWSKRTRHYRRDGLDLVVLPGVFHPGLFISTGLMAEHVAGLDLTGRSFLELGAGSGRIALTAARKGAHVTASDISDAALENLRINSARNRLPIDVVRSDLFDALPMHFDMITINPPYYPYDAENDAERAFFAGRDHGYFVRLFPELKERVGRGSEVYMVLSADLDQRPIGSIAARNGLKLTTARRKQWLGEVQVVHRVMRA